MKEYHPITDRVALRRYMGNISQMAGLRKYQLDEGRAKGVSCVDVRTGAGLEYTVLPDRGMDIAWTSYRGVPVSYISNVGVSAPNSYESEGMEWLRGFYAGMLTTCGFQNVGGPCGDVNSVVGARRYGLHGRLSYLPATEVSARAEWIDGKYVMSVEGKVTESQMHCENTSLRRRIKSVLGDNRIIIRDVIENEDNDPQPMMLLYHMNVGHPILDANARLLAASIEVVGADETAQSELDRHASFHAPVKGCKERCYFHSLAGDRASWTKVAVVNEALELGVCFKFRLDQLGCMTEWKMLNEGEYVVGIEPGTNNPIGRCNAKEKGCLTILQPGEIRTVDIEIEILDGLAAIKQAEQEIDTLRKQGIRK